MIASAMLPLLVTPMRIARVGLLQLGGELVGELVAEDRPERRDAGRVADLAERRVHAGRHSGAVEGDDAHRGGRERGVDHADPDARDDQTGDEMCPRRVERDPVHEHQAGADNEEPGCNQPLRRDVGGEPAGDRGGEERRDRQEQEAQSCADGVEAEHDLEVDHQIGEQREDRGGDRERRDQATDERRLAQESQIEHRVLLQRLRHHEEGEQHGGRDEAADDEVVAPLLLTGADQTVDQGGQTGAERGETEPVGASSPRVVRLRDPGHGDGEGEDADRDVDEEDPPPRETAREQAADDRADRDRETRRCTEGAERDASVAALVGRGQQGQPGREHGCTADPLEPAGRDEQPDVLGRAAGHRAREEQRDADREDPAPAVEVGERPGGQQQGGEAECIGIHHPLQSRQSGVEITLDVGQCDVHDGDVEQQDEDARADGDQSPPLLLRRRPGVRGLVHGFNNRSTHRRPEPSGVETSSSDSTSRSPASDSISARVRVQGGSAV